MKKYLTLLFLVCAVALTFTGCSNSYGPDGDNPGSSGNGSIIGTWYGGNEAVRFTLTFKEDGSFSYTTSVAPNASVSGTYTLYGSKLTVRANDESNEGTYFGSTISFPSEVYGGLFAGLTFTKQ